MRRRDFVMRAAQAGGYAAALSMIHALGLAPAAFAAPPPRDPTIGRGRRVIVLGGGVAGLVSAYELDKAGFAVTVLEARTRVGGRNYTVRGGDRLAALDGPTQDVAFDPGHYFNCGPARLPSHHETILGYCRELGVPLEVEINASRSAWIVRRDGRRIRMRQAVNDTRGHVAELLAKMANQGALDESLEGVERKQMLDFLRAWGALDETYAFNGTDRSGFITAPGAADQTGQAVAKLPLADITDRTMFLPALFEELVVMQPTMFQPVGGMDQIPKAFARALDGRIRLGCEVRAIRAGVTGASVTWREGGDTRTMDADFVVATLPAPLLARVQTNFSTPYASAIRSVIPEEAVKVAWQAPRFWEREDQIYGGLTYMDHEVSFLWYPSAGLHSAEGVMLGAYAAGGDNAIQLGRKRIAAQLASSRAAVELAHPGRSHLLKHGVAIHWTGQQYNQGAWSHLDPESDTYKRLNEPEGRVYLAGDWLSHVVGWQEGAALSAHRAIAGIVARTRADNLAAPM